MDKNIITSATAKLQLITIALHDARLIRDKDQDPLSFPRDLDQRSMLRVKAENLTYEAEKESVSILRCFVSLGLRAVKEEKNNRAESKAASENVPEVYFTVEATFRVDYQIVDALTKEESDEFTNFNAVHNVWPFWRHYVFETLRSADLPLLRVPLMRGLNITRKLKPRGLQ